MIIQKVEIKNFRLFYGNNEFAFTNGLNLIIGSSGDGKTTFCDALRWLFRTDGAYKMDTKFISRKRWEELLPNDSDEVRVAMSYEQRGKHKVLVKHFRFTKSHDGEVNMSDYFFSLIEGNGTERVVKEGVFFEKDLPSEVLKFTIFEGGGDLSVLQSSNAMKYILDSHSEVRDFEAYSYFLQYATKNAEKARDRALKDDMKNAYRITQLKDTIKREKALLADVEREILDKNNEAENFEGLLRNIEHDNEATKLLVAQNHRIESLSAKRAELASRIREDYTNNLLSDMWILLGFKSIADEYSEKVMKIAIERNKIQQDYLLELGVEKLINSMQSGEIVYYKHDYVGELQKRNAILYLDLAEIERIPQRIKKAIAQNEQLHIEVKKTDAKLEEEFMQKKRILAQSDSLSEEQLLANYENIASWMDKKSQTENRIDALKRLRIQRKGALEEAQLHLSKISEGTVAERFSKIALLFQHISNAFENAKTESKRHIVNMIEDKANMFLQSLYTDDYTGVIRIIEKQNGQAEIFLMDGDSSRVFNPSYSLRKTYLLSVLLAIGEVLEEKDSTEMPLIVNDTFSCYDSTDGNLFFNSTNRQMIILTSDYLKLDKECGKVIDTEKLESMSCTAYRIEKKRPFDNTQLSTMQTIITKIQ